MESQEINRLMNASNSFSDERSFLVKLSSGWFWIIWMWITASLVVGWIAKYYIYLHIFKTKIKDQVSPYLTHV